MKKAKLLFTMLMAVFGWNTVMAEDVSPYTVDFNSAITTSSIHDFAVASNWGHIVGSYTDDYGDTYYMTYSYRADEGIDGSGTLLAYKQRAEENSYNGADVYDLLVTPVVSGEVSVYVKASNSANTSYPSYVEFYELNDAGTAHSSRIQRFVAADFGESDVEGWGKVTINVADAKKIGIRAQHVYLDNFSAATASITAEKKLTVTGIKSPTGSTPVYYNQKEDGTVDVNMIVKLKNAGDVDFAVGDENYTLTFVKKEYYGSTETPFEDAKFDIPVAIAAGEEAEFEAVFTVPSTIGTSYFYGKVREDISGTVSSAMLQSKVNEYASEFLFDKAGTTYYTSSKPTTTPIDFGMVTAKADVEYEIYNRGSAPLVINSFTLGEPFEHNAPSQEFTLNGGEKQVVLISLPADNPGVFSDVLTIEYTDFGKDKKTYTLPVSGTVIDPNKNLITFDDGTNGQFPAGSIHSDQVYISSETVGEETNYFLQSTSTTTKFVTPLLTAEAGESFSFNSWYKGYSSTAEVLVYTSTDRVNWTQVLDVKASSLGSSAKSFVATIEEAGDYYLAFELKGNALLDNIYGLTLAPEPEHDWYLISSDIPAKGKQNNDYTATVKVQNISADADEVETATLYMDGEAVAVVEGTALAVNDKTAAVGTGRNGYSNIEAPEEISFTFKPHFFGTVPAYIELKSGETVLATEEVEVTIAEEKVESDVAVGEAKTTSSKAPFYPSWWDNSVGSMSDFYYTSEQLTQYGVTEGAKITAITFKGTPTSNKSFSNLKLEAWVGMEEAGSFTAGSPDKDNMTHVVMHEGAKDFADGEQEDFVIDLSANPIVYDGTSNIRIYTLGNGGGKYISINFQADNAVTDQAYYAYGTTSYNREYSLPVAYMTLDVEAKTLSGTVTSSLDNSPVEGATVTVRNEAENVEYTATTDGDGKYTMDIVQDKLVYNTLTVEAEGYRTITDESADISFEGSNTQNFQLDRVEVVNISKSTFATLYYENLNLRVPAGVTASAVKKNGRTITLTPVGDIIPAGVPVVLNAPTADIEGPDYEFEVTNETATAPAENDLVGSEEGGTYDDAGFKYYVLSWKNAEMKVEEVGFYFLSGSKGAYATVAAHQAFLRVPDSQANEFGYQIDDTNAINTVAADVLSDTDEVYTLSGMRVKADNLKRGIYIVNGKKVVVK